MFLQETGYRLGEFILIERSSVVLTWVLQYPMGMQRSGKSYVIGDILVIMPWERYSPGYLRMEFYDLLMKLPRWTKTTFFCIASGLRCVDVGMGSVDDVIEQLAIKTVSFGSVKAIAPGLFRLGRYKITASDNNLITWQAIGSNNKIISGAGCIQSGILILDSPKGELPEATRKTFYSELKSLPPWSQTPVWGHAESLKICNDQEPRKNFHVTSWIPGFTENFQGDRILSSLSKRNEKESIAEPNAPYKEHLKMKWAFLGDLAILTFKLVDSGLRRCIIIFEKVGNCFAKKWVIFSQPHPDKDSS